MVVLVREQYSLSAIVIVATTGNYLGACTTFWIASRAAKRFVGPSTRQRRASELITSHGLGRRCILATGAPNGLTGEVVRLGSAARRLRRAVGGIDGAIAIRPKGEHSVRLHLTAWDLHSRCASGHAGHGETGYSWPLFEEPLNLAGWYMPFNHVTADDRRMAGAEVRGHAVLFLHVIETLKIRRADCESVHS